MCDSNKNNKNYFQKLGLLSLLILLLLLFLSESLTKILENQGYNFYRVGIFVKIIFLILYSTIRPINRKLFFSLTSLLTLYILSQVFINNEQSLLENLKGNFIYLSKYLFLFILADFVNHLNLDKKSIKKLVKAVLIILRINFIAIIIGVIFDVNLFATYSSNRFGYNGFIQMNSHASYIYMFSTIYVIFQYLKTKKLTIDFIIIILSGLIIGTKSLYLFYFLMIIYFVFHFKLHQKIATYIVLLSTVIISIFFYDIIYTFLYVKFKVLFNLYYDEGLVTALTSTRNILLEVVIYCAFYDYWRPINYLIGGGFFNEIRSEMAFVDLFLFWGVIGSFIYLKLYHKYIIKHYFFNPFLKYSILSILLVAFFGGNFFTNAVIAIYIVIFTNFFIFENEK